MRNLVRNRFPYNRYSQYSVARWARKPNPEKRGVAVYPREWYGGMRYGMGVERMKWLD